MLTLTPTQISPDLGLGTPTGTSPKLRQQAQDLEGLFLNTLVSQMFSGIDARNGFGGGYAEETWRSMQAEQISNQIAKAGGIGLADSIMRDLLAAQESSRAAPSPSQSGAH